MKENRLIADFMGLKEHEGSYYLPLYNSGDWIPDVELEYHTDWNWLMPVVEKIETFGFEFIISENRVKIKHNTDHSIEELFHSETIGSKLNTTYKAVVEFIKQFNK